MAGDPDKEREYRDQLLCKRALERGLLTVRQLKAAFNDRQKEVLDGKLHPRSLEQVLLDEGVLTEEEIKELHRSLQPPPPPARPRFGRFELGAELGRGPNGVVFEAIDPERGGPIALKIIDPPPTTDPREIQEAHDRFVTHARALVTMPSHPGLVPVLEAGVIDGRRYLVMERVAGKTLTEWRRAAALSIRLQISMLRDVALAVHHAHQQGVTHRNLKPENILVDSAQRPRITDFGVARAAGGQATVTFGAGRAAPLDYMSPEEMRGHADVDQRADIYALGVLLYEAIAGRRPFEGAKPFELVDRTLNDSLVPPSRVTVLLLNPMVFANLESICLIAMARDPGGRYVDAKAFAEDLTRWLTGAEKRAVVPTAWRSLRARRPLKLAASAAAVLLAASAGGAWYLGGGEGAPEGSARAAPTAAIRLDAPIGFQAGSLREVFAGIRFNAPALRGIDERGAFAAPGERAWPGEFVSVRWTGYLDVPESGRYQFVLESVDGARLFLDGRPVIDSGSVRAPDAAWGSAELEEGFRPFRLDFHHSGSEGVLDLAWKREAGTSLKPIGPGELYHDPSTSDGPKAGPAGAREEIPGAREAEDLEVLGCSGVFPEIAPFRPHRHFRSGAWSGPVHLRWGRGVEDGDRLRMELVLETAASTIALGLTRGPDHGTFRVSVNGRVLADSLDLYAPRLSSGETVLEGAGLRAGANELEFTVTGSHPEAVEWTPGAGARILGFDYVRVP